MVCGGFVLRVCTSSSNLGRANPLPAPVALHPWYLRYLRYLLRNTPPVLPVIPSETKYHWAVTRARARTHTYAVITIENIWKSQRFCRYWSSALSAHLNEHRQKPHITSWSTRMYREKNANQISIDIYLTQEKNKSRGEHNWHWCWCSFVTKYSPE